MPSTRDRFPDADEAMRRVVIEGVDPEIDGGAFPAHAVVGDSFRVEADIFADGHDELSCRLLHRTERQRAWREVEMEPLGNDRWHASFTPDEPGRCVYSLEAWIDRYGSWLRDLRKRVAAGQDVAVDLLIGAELVEDVAGADGTRDADRTRLEDAAALLRRRAAELEAGDPDTDPAGEISTDLDDLMDRLGGRVATLMERNDPRRHATRYPRTLDVVVDRERAAFSAWYEFFPRSTGAGEEHGTFETAADFLPYVAGMGFDVVYLPPIHPIGRTKRKGRNNRIVAEEGDVGSPWAIGSSEGGHTAVHPELGTLEDFRAFRERAEELDLEVALDVAFQASPDHPWVEEHPEWFTTRPDGTVQYAENPPKKYEDIYPINFESDDWRGLWKALAGVFEFWMDQGVRIFRVDNPHTKSLPFWQWVIPRLKQRDPGLILLSEAFTRPRMMYRLAKLGFTQSYTYFAWRRHGAELREYMTELTRSEVRHYFRPNFWPNTPDILTDTLQHGGRAAFMVRLVLASTLTANYGIYGPAFELLEHVPRSEGSEEYLDSEKYQIRTWEVERPDSLAHFIGRMNRIRRRSSALQRNRGLTFHDVDNDHLLAYSKRSPDGEDVILTVVNMDPHHRQSGWVDLDLDALGLEPGTHFRVHDLLGDGRYGWYDRRNYVELDPGVVPAHVFRILPTPDEPNDHG